MEVLRRCPLAIAQRLVHCAIACFNCRVWAVSQGQCPLHCCWETTRSERSPTSAAQLHLPTHDLFWANLKVQLHLPPLRSLDLSISPGTLRTHLCWFAFIGEEQKEQTGSWHNRYGLWRNRASFVTSTGDHVHNVTGPDGPNRKQQRPWPCFHHLKRRFWTS